MFSFNFFSFPIEIEIASSRVHHFVIEWGRMNTKPQHKQNPSRINSQKTPIRLLTLQNLQSRDRRSPISSLFLCQT